MSRISLNELHEEILDKLTQKEFLKRINLSEEKIQSLVLNKIFITKLSILISKENITCHDVKELSLEILYSLAKELPENWLEYIYEYILFKSFPESINTKLNPKYEDAVIVYLEILRTVFLHIEKHREAETYSFNTFMQNSNTELDKNENFQKFRHVYINNYIYELIILNYELTNSNLYFRINGVWNLSMQIANKLKATNVDVKLWLVCSLTIGYFIGNYALNNKEEKSNESSFHAKQWFERFGLSNIGDVSIYNDISSIYNGHLPIESLILIYSNLRVEIKANGKIYYNSIEQINKNINEYLEADKEQSKLYIEKIKDFENFLLNNNVDIKFSDSIIYNIKKDVAFLEGNEIIEYYKNISVDSNIKVMNLLSDDTSFNYMIERAKSSKTWKEIIIYLNIFDEYTLYLSKNKKLKLIDFLYDLLNNSDGEIRKLAAKLLGKIIALFDMSNINNNFISSKPSSIELWQKYLELIIFSGNIEDRENAIFYLHDFIESLIKNTKNDKVHVYLDVLLRYFDRTNCDDDTVIMLLTSLPSVEMHYFNEKQVDVLFNNIVRYLNYNSEDIKFVSLNYLYTIIKSQNLEKSFFSKILDHVQSINMDDKVGINFLKYKILLSINKTDRIINEYNDFMRLKSKRISEIFLINLKAATNWMEKIVNIDFILDIVRNSNDVVLLHTAAHLCNLVKVSAKEVVRNKAGKALLSIGPLLTIDQRNEISIELLKGLEIDEFEFSKYIPSYLGKFILLLHPKELDEVIIEIQRLYKESNSRVSSLALKTLSIMTEYYSEYTDIFEQSIEEYNNRLIKILSIIASGLANNDDQIKMDTFFFIGNQIFNSKILSDKDKYVVFKYIGKKLLNLLEEKNTSYLYFLNRAISFNYIYKFISSFNMYNNKFDMPINNKIAYFCNTFDPFNQGHKSIINEIKKLGFDVYLDTDEFSWWKNTQPCKIRRKIIDISIADEFNTYLLPENLKINLGNNTDLVKLKSMFSNKDIYVVSSEKMLLNEATYGKKLIKNSAYYLNHITFISNPNMKDEDKIRLKDTKEKIKGNVIELNSLFNDLSMLVDSQVSKYINNTSIYLKQPQDKTIANKRLFKIEIIDDLSEKIVDEIGHYIFMHTNLYQNIGEELVNKNISLLVIRENSKSNKLLGFSAFHHIGTAQMFHEFGNIEIANYVRENTSGKIIIIDGMYTNPAKSISELEQTLLTETLLYCLKNDFTYALYCNTLLSYNSDKTFELLELHGFKRLNIGDFKNDIYAVDMKFPICLTLDIQDYIKEPLISSKVIKDLIVDTRKKLKNALTKLYPNSLVLSFDVEMLQQALVEKVSEVCNNSNKFVGSDGKNEYICVPVGNVLNGKAIPCVATKSLHIEKTYNYDIRDFKINEYPFYSSISNQVDIIKSFDRPIILVDDVMHNCHEVAGIDPILKNKDVNIQKIIVGILSSNGKDIMEMHDRRVDSAYFIPNLRLWLRESMLYPFFGGNTVQSKEELKLNLIPSINHILPYTSPSFVIGASKDVIYDLSMLCLENTCDIFHSIEQEYKNIFDKNLVLKNLCEVVKFPRYPVRGNNIYYDLNQSISSYIENDIKDLIRIERIVKY